jgi:hypothetical protein
MDTSVLDSIVLEGVRVEMAKLQNHCRDEAKRYAESENYHNAMTMKSQAEGYGMACLFLARKIGLPEKMATRAVFIERQTA